jgi:hypothetical protein
MKNKKGILMPEMLKIIVAVISIGFLIYLGIVLVNMSLQKTEVEQAKATLDQVIRTVDSLEDGGEEEQILESRSGENLLVYFGDDLNNKLLCFCFDSYRKDLCVEKGQGVCENVGYDFEMLTTDIYGTDIQYLKLDNLLVRVKIKRIGTTISIINTDVEDEGGVWVKFAALKLEEACPGFVEYYSEFFEVLEFDNIEKLIIDLPNQWGIDVFHQRVGFLQECVKEFQGEEDELFGMGVIFLELPSSATFVFDPFGSNFGGREDYWETILMSENDEEIIIKIYPESFE